MDDDDDDGVITAEDFERIVEEWNVLKFTREWWESDDGRACAARLRAWEIENAKEKLH